MVDKTVQECMEDLMELRANILEDLGQAKKTLSQLVGIFNTIVKIYLLIRKGSWRALRRTIRGLGYRLPRKLPRGASNAWLGYYYGIRPMISTFNALCRDYSAKNGNKVTKKRKVSQGVDPKGFVTGVNLQVTGKAEFRVQTALTVVLRQSADFRFVASLGLTNDFVSDALVTIWALLPYSFLIDWILPVERFLRTRRFMSGVEYQYGYISKSLVCDAKAEGDCVGLGTGQKTRPGPSVGVKAIQFQRVGYNFVPPSGLSINQSLNPINLINAYALFINKAVR
jgi:hypothetical protein